MLLLRLCARVCVCVWFAVKSGVAWYHTARWGLAKHKQIRRDSKWHLVTSWWGTCFDSHQKRPKTARKADASLVLAAQLWRLLESTTRCAKWLMFLIWTLGNRLCLGNPPPSNNAKMKFVSIQYTHMICDYIMIHYTCYMYLHVLHILIWFMLYPNYICAILCHHPRSGMRTV